MAEIRDLAAAKRRRDEQDDEPITTTGSASRALLDPRGTWQELERRIFATNQFFRLWLAQVITATGDWLFFFAVTFSAARVSSERNAAASVGLVVAVRIVPGLFLSPIAGVLADRWDRRRLMVTTDLARACVVLLFPFVTEVWQLVALSFVLEVFTLLWIPAKEASVPNLLPRRHLTTANSLSILATYGTVLVAAAIFFSLAPGADQLSRYQPFSSVNLTKESLSFYIDAATFGFSAVLLSTLRLPPPGGVGARPVVDNKMDWAKAWRDFVEGLGLIMSDPTVRAVNLGLATGMIGAGMVIPLGSVYVTFLGGGLQGWTAMCVGLGLGAALSVLALSLVSERLDKRQVFVASVFGCGVSLILAASINSLVAVIAFMVVLGGCAAPVYVTGFTLIQETVSDEMRGRVFSTLYSLMRICVAIALVIGPVLSTVLGNLSRSMFGQSVTVNDYVYRIPGERLTLWLGGLVILGAAVLATKALGQRDDSSPDLRVVPDDDAQGVPDDDAQGVPDAEIDLSAPTPTVALGSSLRPPSAQAQAESQLESHAESQNEQ